MSVLFTYLREASITGGVFRMYMLFVFQCLSGCNTVALNS